MVASLSGFTLRGGALGARFLLLLALARYLEPEQLGVYGLLTAAVGIAVFALGFDFYVFSGRELMTSATDSHNAILANQVFFYLAAYVLGAPVLLGTFVFEFLAWELVAWFYVLLVLNHASQELLRLHIALERPIVANLVLFLRTGIWGYAVVGLLIAVPATRALATVWWLWSAGALISVMVGVWALRSFDWVRNPFRSRPDWHWIRQGVRIALPFLIGTVALRCIEVVDRYFLDYYHGKAAVGVYTFYASMASAAYALVFGSIIAVHYPKLVRAYEQKQRSEYRRTFSAMGRQVLIVGFLLCVLLGIGVASLQPLLERPEYFEHLPAYGLILVSNLFLMLSMLPHYALYARRRDRAIVSSFVAAFLVNLVANIALVPRFGLLGAAVASVLATLVLGLVKTIALVAATKAPQDDLAAGRVLPP